MNLGVGALLWRVRSAADYEVTGRWHRSPWLGFTAWGMQLLHPLRATEKSPTSAPSLAPTETAEGQIRASPFARGEQEALLAPGHVRNSLISWGVARWFPGAQDSPPSHLCSVSAAVFGPGQYSIYFCSRR